MMDLEVNDDNDAIRLRASHSASSKCQFSLLHQKVTPSQNNALIC